MSEIDGLASLGISIDQLPAKNIARINRTAEEAYALERPGIGAGDTAFTYLKQLCNVEPSSAHTVLDVGFGSGGTLRAARDAGCPVVCGVDIAQSCLDSFAEQEGVPQYTGKETAYGNGNIIVHKLDVSHDPLPFGDDMFNIVCCTETFEHLTNPYHAMSEMKRVLQHDGLLLMSFPMPEANYGYAGGEHAHVYPGFLEQESYEIFMRQMYFRAKSRLENGASAWYAWRNYKGEGVRDFIHVIAANYTEAELFDCLK